MFFILSGGVPTSQFQVKVTTRATEPNVTLASIDSEPPSSMNMLMPTEHAISWKRYTDVID
jgi:hypothetical protein